jgi:hypothetical protein
MKLLLSLLFVCTLCVIAHGEDLILETPQFAATLQADNNFLPANIRWKTGDLDLLAPRVGLGHEFVSFEEREKIYHCENEYSYSGQSDPRFAHEVVAGAAQRVEKPGYRGAAVDLTFPYARVQRTIWLGETAPRLTVEYSFTFTRDVVLHETHGFHVTLCCNDAFSSATVMDASRPAPTPLTANGLRDNLYVASLLNPGGELFSTPHGPALLVESSAVGAADEPPVQLLTLRKGERFSLRLELEIGNPEDLQKRLREYSASRPAYFRPFALLEVARLREARGELKEAQDALLLAARLNPAYAAPFGQLAGLRRDHKLPGQAWAWAEGAYRNPYNYGYMLSARDLPDDETLSEEQKRLHLFNILIAVENIPFYPDYYSWAARGFEKMGMYAQAAAIYRQASWALQQAPYAAAKKAKIAEGFQRQLTELEGKMVGRTLTALPALTPVRPSPGDPQ